MAVIASDLFNRANEATLASPWVSPTTSEQALRLVSNQAQYQSGNESSDSSAYYNTTWPNDQYSQVKVSGATAGGGGAGSGPYTRQATAARTHYRLVVSSGTSGNLELSKSVAGTYTQIWSRSVTYSAGAVVRLESEGTTQRGFYNGSQVGANSTDSSISSGYAGIGYSSVDTGSIMDDWEGGDFTSGATTSFPFFRNPMAHMLIR